MQTLLRLSDLFSWRLTQTLLHFLWQGAVIGLAALLLDRLMKRASSSARYSLHLSALLLMTVCLPLSFASLDAANGRPDARDGRPNTLRAMSAANRSVPPATEAALAEPIDILEAAEVPPGVVTAIDE